jgi:hypothetical protein
VATKADFAADEWATLQFALVDTIGYMAVVTPGLWASFKEAGAAAQFIAHRSQESPSELVRFLAADVHMRRDELVAENPANVEDPVLSRIEAAVALVQQIAPDELAAFRDLIRGVARAEAQAHAGISPHESDALDKIEEALGSEEPVADDEEP